MRSIAVVLHALLLLLVLTAAQEGEDGEERASLLLYKKVTPSTDLTIGKSINVTITVYNKGPGSAYSLMVTDDNWKSDKFRFVSGGNNFTVDFLNADDKYEHEFTIKPIRKMWHRVRPARMVFVEFTDGEQTITHLSNSLPEMRVIAKKDTLGENLLIAGRIATFNIIKTKQGWMVAAFIGICLVAVQLHFVGSKVLHKRRHLRALEDVKNM
uniref:Translocon-associated protein subunit beta n=1 Tax=Calcidiscus leptoporus TaxID=127549 RepID=A0A7S0J731_9EUKA